MLNVTRRSMLWFLAVALTGGAIAFQLSRLSADDTAAQTSKQQSSEPAAEKAAQILATSYSLTEDENDERIRQALKKSAKFDFEEKPLREFLEEISKQHNIPIWIDDKALADEAIATDTPLTRKVQNVSLESALRLALRPLQLEFRIDKGVLQITTQDENDQRLTIRVYPVQDLIVPFDTNDASTDPDFDAIVDLITSTIVPNSWDSVGGQGSTAPYGQSLVISQTPDTHEQIEALVWSLQKVRVEQRRRLGGNPIWIDHDDQLMAVNAAMQKPVNWEFNEDPLRDVADFLAKQSGLVVQLDDRALAEAAIAADTPITLKLNGVRMKDALTLLLHPLQLTFVVRDEVLLLTTQSEADEKPDIRVYPVGDLLECESAQESEYGRGGCDYDWMIDLLVTTVAPNSWDTVGGPATVEAFENAKALVISHTQDVHEQIEALISRLRKLHVPSKGSESAEKGTVQDEPVLRVYVLHQRVPKQAAKEDAKGPGKQTTTSRGLSQGQSLSLAKTVRNRSAHATIGGFGGGATADFNMEEIRPPGVPAVDAERVIRGLIAPDSWTQPGREMYAAPNFLVVKQTRAVHREIAALLTKLGPWHETSGFYGGGLGGSSIGGGAFCGSRDQGRRLLVSVIEDQAAPNPFVEAFQVADPFGPPTRKEETAGDPFGPAAGQPAETPSQKTRQGGLRRAEAVEGGQGRKGGAGDAARANRPNRPASFVTYRMSPAEARIRDALGNETDLEFNEVGLRDAIDFIKDKHGIEIQLDERLLTEATVTTDTPITINVKGISLRSALRLMLARLPNNPTFVIGDEVLLITTREGAAERKLVRIYNVGELIETRRGPEVDPFGGPAAPSRGGYGAAGPRAPMPADHLTELANVIQQAVEPGTWTPDHGCAVVPLLTKDSALLVVRQSALAHEEVVELLKSIQDAQREQR